ncbi:RagB/SusD family nutrient uptake outer membrane protein [Chryseobacterium sp. MEBOG07]|uniref:RagB/SusD family nutrient uptake outer membrane protein n=1 Tax=Chryseobacterium sp. MEBOG07 TaxID=2879939 RepID=UPI001F2AA4D6|nr:RagB/SusD family nutrient uptake outer membrane protein [Chryseobacterium sp. MEBOG07]UKB78575.1 RagB/SusD family nutrient uptake outer membrane protein [Chryseobacterium sp. MEBOG07]
MKKITIYRSNMVLVVLTIAVLLQSCKKSWLDAKPDKALVVPTSIEDFQAILDNNTVSQLFNFNQPALSEMGAGDFQLEYNAWQALPLLQERSAYVWDSDLFVGEPGFDWNNSYKRILYANIVLEGISHISAKPQDQTQWNQVKGTALFYRSYDFFNLVQDFAKAYDRGSATRDLGIPLRLNSNINTKTQRATVQETYDQIIADLLTAKTLLPDQPAYVTRGSKCAVYALLSKVYLHTAQYDLALKYADSCLRLNAELLDFNTLDSVAVIPISRFNKEVVYHHNLALYAGFDKNASVLIVDPQLYNAYDANDLRKTILFKNVSGLITRNASYSGDNNLFGGLATDEMYLIKAECYARENNTSAAMESLNILLAKRWKTGTFIPFTATNAENALSKVITERRKELVFRGNRWHDLKRLNTDPRFAISLTRDLNGKVYTLLPNDNKYTLPIPPDEVRLSGLVQNPR